MATKMRMNYPVRPRLAGYVAIFASAILFGTYGVWSHLMGSTFQPFYQAWARSLIVVIVMLPLMFWTKSFRKIAKADIPAFAFYIAFCVCTQVPLYYAFNHASIGAAQLIFYAVFVITAYIVGTFYLGEKITKVKLAAIVLAFVGLCVVFGSSVLAFAPLGLILAGVNGIASGGEVSSTKKISGRYPPLLIAFVGWSATVVVHLPLSILLGEKQWVPAFTLEWLWLFVYAIVGMVAFWLVVEGYRHVDASIGSLLGLSEIIFAIIFGALIFHQSLTVAVVIGGLIILSAGMLPDIADLYLARKAKRINRASEPIREL